MVTELTAALSMLATPAVVPQVGVAPTIEKQKRQHALEAERQAAESAELAPTLGVHDIDLPPSEPVGIR